MVGLNKFSDKDRRRQRLQMSSLEKGRRNHVARDLASSKYRQRVIPDKKKNSKKEYDQLDDDE